MRLEGCEAGRFWGLKAYGMEACGTRVLLVWKVVGGWLVKGLKLSGA